MSVSYLINLEQLSILAYFSGIEAFPSIAELPSIDRERCDTLLKKLGELGMIRMCGDKASVDLGLSFVLSAMADPELIIQTTGNVRVYLTASLGVIVSEDSYSQKRYRITPFPTADELAQRLWEITGACFEYHAFSFYRKGIGWKSMQTSYEDIKMIMSQVYREAIAD